MGKRNRKVLLSTGMSNIYEIEEAIRILIDAGQERDKITVLQCTSEYPTPDGNINLKSMITMAERFNLPYGLSDHTLGITAPIAAAAMGASVIEKHITLDKTLPGPDHKASINLDELKEMCIEVRRVIDMLGNGKKVVTEEEHRTRLVARKSIVASRNLKSGDKLDSKDIAIKRPGNGISAIFALDIIGSVLKRNILEDEVIINSDIDKEL
jgi:N,N'-diacetyllegionaminate synthase